MKPVQLREDDHKWLNEQRDLTGVPMSTQIHFLIEEKKRIIESEKAKDSPLLQAISK